ncbi:uncharacterized protein LOC129290048 [Prosopis cineraria]|uniref:uncharacterized protein LOC129290048 n=1 Tax=Prosopis cineraria TaxID=364024 RepID=UPI00240F414F|nr:uncharacterized protein LOC129290048 [Prosopis cineraria]
MEDHANEVADTSLPLNMEASMLFPPKGMEIDMNDMIGEKNITTKRFMFSEDSLCTLKEEISRGFSFMPTRVQGVTTLIWKPAFEELNSGNLFVPAFSPFLEVDKENNVELQDLAEVVKKAIKMVDGDHASKLQGYGEELIEILESNLRKFWSFYQKCNDFDASKIRDGIEAWVTLKEHHMIRFQNNCQLLQFASFDP